MIHYDFPKGIKIVVILKNGEKIIDKYVDTKSGRLILKNKTIKYINIRSTTIYKEESK